MSQEFTVYQATNPATPPDVLAQMAASRPDLRQFVAANPATPQPVVQWLATLGDLAVDAALARRRPAPPAPGQGPVPFPPPGGHPGTRPPAPGPGGGPPGGGWAPTAPGPHPPADPYARPAPPYAATGNPYAPPGGAPGTNPYAPSPAASYGPGPGLPVGVTGAPQDAYGYQLPEPGGRRVGLIIAIAVGAVLVIGALIFAASTIFTSVGQGSSYGDDQHLDRLWDACADGDGEACDDLYLESPLDSEYEEFGDTCGHRYPPQQVWCEDSI